MKHYPHPRALLLAALLAAPVAAQASCGSAFCAINTGADTLGGWVQPGTRVDLRYEYVPQDRLRSGSHRVSPAGEVDEHDEIRTVNRNWLLMLDHNFEGPWGVSLVLPYVDRRHEHVHNADDGAGGIEPELESWRIHEIGDVQVLGRYRIDGAPESGRNYTLRFGLKLPTGRHDVANAEGERAERSLQPGTGTTDVILGTSARGPLVGAATWYAAAQVAEAVNKKEEFRPGTRAGVDLGVSYPVLPTLSLQAQFNAVYKGRDHGTNAEPNDSGGRFLYVSPGLSWAATQQLTVYGFAQVPVHQHVNGVQLTSRTGFAMGASLSF